MSSDSTLLNANNNDTFLKGSLSLTNITDLLQFLSASYKSGMIQLIRQPGDKEGKIFFKTGEIVNVLSGQVTGLEGFADLLSWDQGTFQFHPDVTAPEKNIGLPVQHAIIQAAVLLDHRAASSKQGTSTEVEMQGNIKDGERSIEMETNQRDSTAVMNDLLTVPGIDAVVVVGRDGFVIESAGNSTRINIDELGASLAHAINGIEEMGSELKINLFQDMFIEYGRAVILCKPVGDAVAAVIAPDASKLGIIRHKTKKYFEELALSF
jgi:predicted regulator of Ras-like GTPase activity (Roadblock/LC7/MglB family)